MHAKGYINTMKRIAKKNFRLEALPGFRSTKIAAAKCLAIFLVTLMMTACASVDPRKVDVQLEESAPQAKITSYTQALSDLGLMTEIFNTGKVKVQSDDIADNTGLAVATKGEIQRNITEMIKSTLNSIGGNVLFIEYNPAYIQNQMVTGYSNFDKKLIPDVVVTGGITEFDRALETRGENTDADIGVKATGLPGWVPGDTAGIAYGDGTKTGKARITLDFNLKNFQTLAGIPRMNTINSLEVHKAVREKELGITIFGPSFGLKGSIKKVQGRHAAVRLLVQLSMIQMMGKYLDLPYWKLLGDAAPDEVVISNLKKTYYGMSATQRIAKTQELLVLYGYPVTISGRIDAPTVDALSRLDPEFDAQAQSVGLQTFINVYENVPIDERTLALRQSLSGKSVKAAAYQPKPAAAPKPEYHAPAKQAVPPPKPAQTKQAATVQQPAVPAKTQPPPATTTTTQPAQINTPHTTQGGGGRVLDESEW